MPSAPAQLPVKQAGLCRACRAPNHGSRGAEALSHPLQGAGLPWPHSTAGRGPWSWALQGREGLSPQTEQLLPVVAFVLVTGAFLLLGHMPMSSSHPVSGAGGKARTRRGSANAASGGLWKKVQVFTLQSTAVSWDPWELSPVVLPTLWLLHFSHACTNSRVSNYRKENWTAQNMKFWESVFLIHVHEKLPEYKVVLLTEQNEEKIYSCSILLFILQHF